MIIMKKIITQFTDQDQAVTWAEAEGYTVIMSSCKADYVEGELRNVVELTVIGGK